MKNKQVIFITGTSYSGSTLLDMIISNDPNGISLGEVNAFFRPYRKHHLEQIMIENKKNSIFYKTLLNGEKNLYKSIFNLNPNVKFIVDSSKDVFWINYQIKNLKKQGIDYKIVLIYKSPENLAYSFYRRNIFSKWQKHYIKYYKKIIYFDFELIYVKSDKIFSNSASLKKLCSSLNITFRADKINYWKKSHKTLFGNNRARLAVSGLNIIGDERIEGLSSKTREQKIDYNTCTDDKILNIISKQITSNKQIESIDNNLRKNLKHNNIYSSIEMFFLKIVYVLKRFSFKVFKI